LQFKTERTESQWERMRVGEETGAKVELQSFENLNRFNPDSTQEHIRGGGKREWKYEL